MEESIIFTCYFATQPNPQRGKRWRKNKIFFLNPLYDSVKRLGLNMLVFHDHLNDKFINRFSTDKIRFEKYDLNGIPNIKRFNCYFEHLKKSIYDKILCLDCHDLELYKDPFPLIGNGIMIGSEQGKIKDNRWVVDNFNKAYKKTYYGEKTILNCGILGGKFDLLLPLLLFFVHETEGATENIDMAVFNKLIYDKFKHITGYPIHTKFTKNEGKESGCYIRHK